MKERNIFIVIIILAIIALGILAYRIASAPIGPNAVAPAVSIVAAPIAEIPASATVINYTDKGFEPSMVTIPRGAVIAFVNKSTSTVWVASAPHPAHTDYPGFDSLKPIVSGASYQFTFERVGTWGYHNHLNPNQIGTVTVSKE